MKLCWITFDDVIGKNVRIISIKNRIKYFSKKWNITIISPALIDDKELQSFIVNNIVISNRIYGKNFKSLSSIFHFINIMGKISKETRNFDIVITDTIYVPFYKYFTRKKIPIVFLSHGIISDELLSKKLIKNNSLMYKILLKIEKKSYQLCDIIIVVTREIKDYLINRFQIEPSKIYVVPNGVDPEMFKPLDMKKCQKELRLNEINYYVCFIGNLAPWQGIEYLIQAAPIILKEIPDIKFLIVGYGPIKENLINLAIKNNVVTSYIFIGAIPYEEVVSYINASDVCVAPFTESRNIKIGLSPLKIYEYAACEKPIVTSKIPNLEFIEEVNAGILIQPGNIDELAQAIVKILRNPELRLQMGRNGRKYVIENYNWISISKKFERVLTDVIEQKKNRSE